MQESRRESSFRKTEIKTEDYSHLSAVREGVAFHSPPDLIYKI